MAELYGETLTVQFPKDVTTHTGDTTAKAPLGVKYRYKGNTYRYILFDNGTGNVAAAAKYCAYWKTLDPTAPTYTVTSDYTDSAFGVGGVAGIFKAVLVDATYGWIQVGGQVQVRSVAGAIAADNLIGSSTDGLLARIAAGSNLTNIPFAIVKSVSTTGGPTVLLLNLDW